MFQDAIQHMSPSEEARFAKNVFQGASENISDESVFADYQKRAYVAVLYSKGGQAYRLRQKLQALLADAPDQVRSQYEPILTMLGFAGLTYFSREELVRFFGNSNILVILGDGIYNDLIQKTRQRLASEPVRERNAVREKIYHALRENPSLFTERASKSEAGTVGNWLKWYDSVVGIPPAATIQRAEFENTAAKQHALDERGRTLLSRLLNFYEFIKLSSFEVEAFEEDLVVGGNGQEFLLSEGMVIPLSQQQAQQKADAQEPFAQATEQPKRPATVYDYSRVARVRDQLLASLGGDRNNAANALAQSLDPASADRGLGALLLLSQLRKLDNLIEDPRFAKLVTDDLKKSHRDDNISGMRANPTAPMYLARLLKVILEDRLGLSHQDAIAFGSRLSKILAIEGEKYQSIIKDTKWNL